MYVDNWRNSYNLKLSQQLILQNWFSSFENKNTEGSQNVGPLAVQPPDVALGQRNFLKCLLQIAELKYIIMNSTKYRVLYLTTLKLKKLTVEGTWIRCMILCFNSNTLSFQIQK